MGMTNVEKLKIGLALQHIAMSVDDETLARIKPYLNTIEDTIVTAEKNGAWTKYSTLGYRCSECGKIQIADDANELNYCCNCGAYMGGKINV